MNHIMTQEEYFDFFRWLTLCNPSNQLTIEDNQWYEKQLKHWQKKVKPKHDKNEARDYVRNTMSDRREAKLKITIAYAKKHPEKLLDIARNAGISLQELEERIKE